MICLRIFSGSTRFSGEGSGRYRWKTVSPVRSARSDLTSGCRKRDFEKKMINCGVSWPLFRSQANRAHGFTELSQVLTTEDVEVVGGSSEVSVFCFMVCQILTCSIRPACCSPGVDDRAFQAMGTLEAHRHTIARIAQYDRTNALDPVHRIRGEGSRPSRFAGAISFLRQQ